MAASGPTMTGPVTVSFTRITTTETHTADKPKPEPAIFSTEELSTFIFFVVLCCAPLYLFNSVYTIIE